MSGIQPTSQAFYASQSVMSDPNDFRERFATLPKDLLSLCSVIQGLVLHPAWAERYGVALDEKRLTEQQNRGVPEILARFLHDQTPLVQARLPEERTVGTCRAFSLLLCAMLRYQGVPARARCGFATYFELERYVDHWVCETWRADEQRWVRVDAQLDSLQCEALEVSFNPLDVPGDRFLSGGAAWQMCRDGKADPDSFGVFDLRGLWFVRGNVVRDLAALNKVELLPWDAWGLVDKAEAELTPQDLELLDRAAELGSKTNPPVVEVQELYREHESFRVSREIRSYTAVGVQTATLPAEL